MVTPRALVAALVLVLTFQLSAAAQDAPSRKSGACENQTIRRYYWKQYVQTIGFEGGRYDMRAVEDYANQQIKYLVAETEKDIKALKEHCRKAAEICKPSSASSGVGLGGGQPGELRQELNQVEKTAAKLHTRFKYIFADLKAEDQRFKAEQAVSGRLGPGIEALDLQIRNAEEQISASLFGNAVVEVSQVEDNLLISLDRVRRLSRVLQRTAVAEK